MFSRQGRVIVYSIPFPSINRRGGSSPLRFVERQDEGRARVKGSVLRSVACLPTHPVLPIAPSQRIYISHRDFRIYMGIYMRGDIYVGLYVWWRERESEREGEGRGGRGWGETTTTLRQNHSTSTAHQSIDTRSKTLSRRWWRVVGSGPR